MDRTLNETGADKNLQYRADYNNRPSHDISFMPTISSTSCRLHSELVFLLFLQDHREADRFLATSGVHLTQSCSTFTVRCFVTDTHLSLSLTPTNI